MANQWVLVPVEPTDEMIDAAANSPDDDDWITSFRNGYRAMLAASPSPEALPASGVEAVKAQVVTAFNRAVCPGCIPYEKEPRP